jgi:hypothetical protein
MHLAKPMNSDLSPILEQLNQIQHLQNRLSAALDNTCYPDDNFIARLSKDSEHQLKLLRDRIEATLG